MNIPNLRSAHACLLTASGRGSESGNGLSIAAVFESCCATAMCIPPAMVAAIAIQPAFLPIHPKAELFIYPLMSYVLADTIQTLSSPTMQKMTGLAALIRG